MLKKAGKILLIACPILLMLTIILFSSLEEQSSYLYQVILTVLFFVFTVGFCSAFTFIYWTESLGKRKRIVFRLSIVSLLLFLSGLFNRLMHWPGAAFAIIIGVFLFTFGGLPLIIRNRYEKRKNVLTGSTVIWSFTDLFGIIFVCLAALGKVMHWPQSQSLFTLGILIFLVSIIGWNFSFRKEVKLKMEAEEKLRDTLKQVEDKNKEIEEKQKAIIDSIEYAKRIQKAQIPTEKYIRNALDRLMKK